MIREQAFGTCFVVAPALCQYYHAVLHSTGLCPQHIDASAFIYQHLTWFELMVYIVRDSGYNGDDVFRQLTREMTHPLYTDHLTVEALVHMIKQHGPAVLLEFAVDASFHNSSSRSFLDPSMFDAAKVRGYHGMVVVGYRFARKHNTLSANTLSAWTKRKISSSCFRTLGNTNCFWRSR